MKSRREASYYILNFRRSAHQFFGTAHNLTDKQKTLVLITRLFKLVKYNVLGQEEGKILHDKIIMDLEGAKESIFKIKLGAGYGC